MSMNTPIGNITQTTPIKNFKELDEMQNEQYLLGIDDNEVGNGSKISLENLINSSISADNGNLIIKGTDDKLLVNTPVEIGDLSDLTTTDKTTLVAAINEVDSDITTEVTNRVNAVSGEATIRANADNNLQSQIDAIAAASDVTDIVGTYAELQAYDTTGLPDNSIIKVLQDESRQNETTYYRWVITGGVGAWVLVGEEGPYYTISQADSKFATQATVGNLSNLATSDKSSVVNAMNELASVLDPTQTADYIKNSKAIYSGEVSENALILPQIKEMAHSTFDRSKFTVVGSPNITDDGIASGFSSSNYLKTIPLLQMKGKSWEVEALFYREYGSSASGVCVISLNNNDYGAQGSVSYDANSSSLTFRAKFGDTDSSTSEGAKITLSNFFSTDGWYYTKLAFNYSTGAYILSGCKLGRTLVSSEPYVPTSTEKQVYAIATATDSTPKVGIGRAYGWSNMFLPSIDLKQFSITVDGVEVFSGNRTGIDTIKPDDYTVEGTPVITVDGIASGFSITNYITNSLPSAITLDKVDVYGQFTTGSTYTTFSIIINIGSTYQLANALVQLGIQSTKKLGIGCHNDTTWTGYYSTNAVSDNTKYYYHLYYDTSLKLDISTDNITWTNWIDANQTVNSSISQSLLTFGSSGSAGGVFNGSIDLNSFKVYVDGNLVYQPCLKIPYTESKTGSKIVDSIYRDRVADMYEQFGYAPYYTLSDTDFTLPQGELYGYLEKRARDIAHPVGVPFYRFDDTINDDEVRLEGAEVDKGLYLAIEQKLSALCTAGSTADKVCLPDFRNRTLWGANDFGYVEAGLPDHSHNLNVTTTSCGADPASNPATANMCNGDYIWTSIAKPSTTNASANNSIYGNSTTVQPPAVKVRWLARWK